MMTTAEMLGRFIKEIAEVGIDDPDTIADFATIALSEHCRAHGGPIVSENRQWGDDQ